MTTSMVYQLSASSFSDIPTRFSQGFADFVMVTSPGASLHYGKNRKGKGKSKRTKADPIKSFASFVSQCNAVGGSPIVNNSNDGTGGCNGQNCNTYYSALAAEGIMAVGGESEQAPEDTAIMNNLIFWNCGGEGAGGGGVNNNNIWAKTGGGVGAVVGPKGCASYLESYLSNSMISASEMGTEAGMNKDAGCKEVGIMIGSWCTNDYGANANTYMEMVDEYASNGVTCAGFNYWYVTGDSSSFSQLAMMQQLMASCPPIKQNIVKRFGGTPPNVETITISAPNTATINTALVFSGTAMYGSTPAATTETITLYSSPDQKTRTPQAEVPVNAQGAFSMKATSKIAGTLYYSARNWEKGSPFSNVLKVAWTNPAPKPVAPATFSYGIHSIDPTAMKANLVGQTFDATGKALPNAQINIQRSKTQGAPTTFIGSYVSDSIGGWNATVPVIAGPNYFWLVTSDGKWGFWTHDVISI